MGLGIRLREERLRLKLNQTDFAALAQVAKNSQLNYEKGERSPDADYLAAIASAGVDVLYVVTGEKAQSTGGGLSAQEFQLLSGFRSLSPEDQAVLARVAEVLGEASVSEHRS
ncbi:helix-turn-helix transcriptional regulator [Pseudomonas sp. zfem005]|uniref:helix-turn-helix domain-containing protein n=1 Tax=Pseudomonas sp. zfem005 TaxID=3078200 RepID=UPI0029289391|nr:helix-turn-helix transcriptional regulator [Pseudomonas sp. zfem005]MDU9414827.1 helix-turn-helix transcriptional regulator [Pseudomonas sp. zfem005]